MTPKAVVSSCMYVYYIHVCNIPRPSCMYVCILYLHHGDGRVVGDGRAAALRAEDAPELDEDGGREQGEAYVPGDADDGEHARVDGSIVQGLRPKAMGDALVCEDCHRGELDHGTNEGDAQCHNSWELKFLNGRNHGEEADSHGSNSEHESFVWRR
jgi:hypothetical protein